MTNDTLFVTLTDLETIKTRIYYSNLKSETRDKICDAIREVRNILDSKEVISQLVEKPREEIIKEIEDDLNERHFFLNPIHISELDDLRRKYNISIKYDTANDEGKKFTVTDMEVNNGQ